MLIKSLPKGVIGLTLFALLMTPFLLSLGFWQLQRADEKQQIFEKQSQSEIQPAVQLASLAGFQWEGQAAGEHERWAYRKISVTGRYDQTAYLLLDNRTRNGNVGYEVISLFKTDDDSLLLVNRGWVKAPIYRDQWPIIESDIEEVTLTGTLYFPSSKTFTLTDGVVDEKWPRRVQKLDITVLSQELNADVFPFTLRLSNDEQAGAFQTGWKISQMSPDKHTGYATQWFGLALVLVVMTIIGVRKMLLEKDLDAIKK